MSGTWPAGLSRRAELGETSKVMDGRLTARYNRPPASRAAADSLSGMGCQMARWSPGFWARRNKLFV
jgi:hypothetical protein